MRPTGRPRSGDRLLMAGMLLVAALLAAQLAYAPAPDGPSGAAESGPRAASAGEMRNVDVETIRRRIIEGRLSDREAEHYRKLEPARSGQRESPPR